MIRRFDITDGQTATVYMTRWTITLPLIGWRVRLHHIRRPDFDRCQHDHPWWFLTFILRGGYVERLRDGSEKRRRPGMVLWRSCTFRHVITELPKGSAWTLILSGRTTRVWGFWNRAGRFMPWRPFTDESSANRLDWCEET